MEKVFAYSALVAIALGLSACRGGQKDVSESIERAKHLAALGEKSKAQVELQHTLSLNPASPEANYALAKLEDEEGDLASAMPHYVRAALPDSRLLPAQLRVIEVLLDANRLQEASGRINATLGAFPDSLDALALRAELYAREGDTAKARTDAIAVLQEAPDNARALSVRAMLALQDKNGTQALALIEQGLKKKPDDIRLLQIQAAALLTLNQPDKAAGAIRAILQSAPRNIMAQVALAQIQADEGKVDEGISGFQAAVASDPNNEALQLAFVKFLAAKKPGTAYTAYLENLIARAPDTGIYDLALAGYYHSQSLTDQSEAVLNRAAARLGMSQNGLAVRVALARVAAEAGHSDVAVHQLDTVLAEDPVNAEALLYRAQLRLAGGRALEASQDLLTVLKQEPANGPAYQALANAYLAQSKPELAVEAMRRAASVVPGDSNTAIKLALFLEHARDLVGARETMLRLTLASPQDAMVWVAAAQIAIDQKDWPEAQRDVDRLRSIPQGKIQASILDGQLLAARGDAAAAAKRYAAVITASDDFDPSLIGAYTRVCLQAGLSSEAATLLTQRAPVLKGEAQRQAWISVMSLKAGAGDFAHADDAYRQLVQNAPKNAESYTAFATLLAAHGQIDEAKRIIAEGFAAGAPRIPLLMTRGWTDSKAGDDTGAAADFKTAMTSDPMSLDAINNYASIVADSPTTEKADLRDLRQRLSGSEDSPNPLIIDTIAWLDYRLGHYEEAKSLLTRIKAGDSQNPQLRFHLAAVLIAKGDKDQGASLLDTVKGLHFPGSEEMSRLAPT